MSFKHLLRYSRMLVFLFGCQRRFRQKLTGRYKLLLRYSVAM